MPALVRFRPSFAEQVGVRIVKARKYRGWSQTELGDLVGCSQSTLSEWETARRALRVEDLAALAYALEVPNSTLLPELPKDDASRIAKTRDRLERARLRRAARQDT